MDLPNKEPLGASVCSFGCLTPLKRKRTLLVCENCDVTVECCLSCAESSDVCDRCAPAVRAANLQTTIRDIVDRVHKDDHSFSIFNFEDELYDQHPEIKMQFVKVELIMDGNHVVNVQYMDGFQSLSIVSAYRGPFEDTEEKLNDWARTYKFDEDKLLDTLEYQPSTASTGSWSGEIDIYIYT